MISLSLRLLRRDWRAGELRVLLAALLIAVSCSSSVAFFTDRIAQALKYQSSELLGADLRLLADQPLAARYFTLADQATLSIAETRSFRSMVLANGRSQLAEIKAVSSSYPLRGQLRVSDSAFAAELVAQQAPASGEVWVDPRLLQQLQLSLGDSLQVGNSRLRLGSVLRYEPDRSGDMFSIAPRLLMNLADLAATGLEQEGSRIRYALLLAGEPRALEEFRHNLNLQLDDGVRLEGAADARREVRTALTRAQQFLGLAAVVAVVLACVAIAMAARRFAQRHLDTCAILRCLGARQAQINNLFLLQLLVLALLAGLLGVALGYGAQSVLSGLLGKLVLVSLPAPSLIPVWTGFGVALAGLLGFALPPVLQLREVPTLRVLRREMQGGWGKLKPAAWLCYLLGAVALALLVLFQSGDAAIGRLLLLGLAATALLLWLVAAALVFASKHFLPQGGSAWRFGLANLTRRTRTTIIQVMAFGLGIMVLLLLTVVRGDLLKGWSEGLPADAPNRFVINIQHQQRVAVQQFFQQRGMSNTRLHPMVRGRLLAINDQAVAQQDFGNPRANHLAQRVFNLSWAEHAPADNTITAGQWWDAGQPETKQFSVEQGIAETLGLKLGDRLTYSIAGETVTAAVTSLRSVKWDSFQANFFVIASPATLQAFPASHITSFYLPPSAAGLLNDLVQAFPNLTVIDVAAIMHQVRLIIERVSMAVEYVFIFTLAAGLAVMYAAIQSSLNERLRENAIMRALGARRWRLWQGLLTEFVLLGSLAGLLASLMAGVLGYLVARRILELDYTGSAWLWLGGLLLGGIGIGLAGIIATRRVVSSPPLKVLRES